MSNQYTKVGDKILQVREYPGILKADYEHEIKVTKGGFTYTGPRIDPAEWQAVLAFFKWTYDTTKSESQVRGYINPLTGQVRFWAFPQEARTGMTAREMDIPAAVTQRAQFSEAQGWTYFLTVHHHCSGSAFQSGTDAANEQTIDGLHITVGNIDQGKHSLHCRFYLCKDKFTPDLSEFWDIGDEARRVIPVKLWHEVAEWQMAHPDVRATFPDQWKENLIEVKHVYTPATTGVTYYGGQSWTGAAWKPIGERAVEDICEDALRLGMEDQDLDEWIEEHKEDPVLEIVIDACVRERADWGDIVKHWKSVEEIAQAELANQQQKALPQPKVNNNGWDADGVWRGVD